MLKDFGRRESEARLALRLIRELRLNQHGIIGARRLCLSIGFQMAYRRAGRRWDCAVALIDASSLRVEQIRAQSVLCDNKRELFNFGADEGGARQALQIIHKYRFTEVGAVNPAAPSMMIFLAQPTAFSLSDSAPASDPLAPFRRTAGAHPGVVARAPIAPAVPPLRELGLFTHTPSATSPTPDRIPFDSRRSNCGRKATAGSWPQEAASLPISAQITRRPPGFRGDAILPFHGAPSAWRRDGALYLFPGGRPTGARRDVRSGRAAIPVEPTAGPSGKPALDGLRRRSAARGNGRQSGGCKASFRTDSARAGGSAVPHWRGGGSRHDVPGSFALICLAATR